ncbi:MAG: dihydroorotate dehydrogenase, partial [Clostridia bacterium]|nr:dihydroorotate dehydrogenase [Clostridia bacterium]
VKIPVVGMGGISDAEGALAFLMAGCTAVQVGAMTFARPNTMIEIIDGLEAYCEQEGLKNISEICGIL